jgi:phage tail-like protein
MAKYTRGMVVKAKVTAKSVSVYTRKMGAGAKTTAFSVAAGTRGMSVAAKTTAVAVAMGTRGMLVAAKITAKSVAVGTRKPGQAAKVTAKKVAMGTRGMKSGMEKDDERAGKAVTGQGAAAAAKMSDPWGNYRFALEINKKQIAHFMECSGLKTSSEVFEIREGGLNGRTHKRVGQSRWENIILRYGSSADNQLAFWRDQYLKDEFTGGLRTNPEKSTGAIVLYNNAGKVLRRYEFKNAWPVSWEGPALSSSGSALAIESIEIAHEGLTVIDP